MIVGEGLQLDAVVLDPFNDLVGSGADGVLGEARAALLVDLLRQDGDQRNLAIERRDGRTEAVPLLVRIDTPIEAAYFAAGGILPYVLEQLLDAQASTATLA